MRREYVTTARAKGVREFRVIVRHALKNALIPMVTVFGLQFGQLMAELLAKSGIAVTPTLQVFRDLVDLLPDSTERSDWQVRNEAHESVVRNLNALGVPLLAGSDAGWRATAFDTFWKELDELVACGLTPVQAIGAATGSISKAWGYDQFGTIQAGCMADLVVVACDVSRDIKRLARVQAVYQAGVKV